MRHLLLEGAGWAGAAALLLAYGLVSAGRVRASGAWFQVMNLLGAGGLAANGLYHDAWPSFALNAIWIAIGLIALRRATSASGQVRSTR
jgi:hypothetical protein